MQNILKILSCTCPDPIHTFIMEPEFMSDAFDDLADAREHANAHLPECGCKSPAFTDFNGANVCPPYCMNCGGNWPAAKLLRLTPAERRARADENLGRGSAPTAAPCFIDDERELNEHGRARIIGDMTATIMCLEVYNTMLRNRFNYAPSLASKAMRS